MRCRVMIGVRESYNSELRGGICVACRSLQERYFENNNGDVVIGALPGARHRERGDEHGGGETRHQGGAPLSAQSGVRREKVGRRYSSRIGGRVGMF